MAKGEGGEGMREPFQEGLHKCGPLKVSPMFRVPCHQIPILH